MGAKKDLQEFLVADRTAVVGNLDDLGVTGFTSADLFVRRILNMPPTITGDNTDYTG